jgi:hypothetical protein
VLPLFLIESLERLIERPVEFGLFGYEPFQFGFGLPALAAAEAAVRQFNPKLLDWHRQLKPGGTQLLKF